MCNFFSFVTDPVNHPAEYYYFDWEYRKDNLDDDGVDSHSHICKMFNLNEDTCNKYEFNPLTKKFLIDQINSERDDNVAAKKWVNRLDFKTIVEPLIVKPIINPFELPKVEHPTDEQIGFLKTWASVWDSVESTARDSVGSSAGYSVWDSVWSSAGDSVWDSVWSSAWSSVWSSDGYSVWDSVWSSVWGSLWSTLRASVRNYISTFFNIDKADFSSAVRLLESGLVPSFDGTIWRLHSGKNADVVFEWKPEVQE